MRRVWLSVVIFAIVLSIRLIIAFQTPYLSSGDAYLQLRAIDNIKEHGTPLVNDSLGYGGRLFIHAPLFDYVMAFFSLFVPFAEKIIPNIFASLLVFPVFLICNRLTNRSLPNITCAALASFVPPYFSLTINHLSPLSLAIPLFFFLVYAWLRVPERKWVFFFLFGIAALAFLHPLSLLFVSSLAIYFAVVRMEGLKNTVPELELGLFSIFFVLWSQFLLYKKLILTHGPSVVWQNMPEAVLHGFFAKVSVLGILLKIGFLPLLLGIYILYKEVFQQKKKDVYVLFAFVSVVFAVMWLKWIALNTALMLMGILLAIALSRWMLSGSEFVKTTKLARHEPLFVILFILVLAFTSLFPAFTASVSELKSTIDEEHVEAFDWIRENIDQNATILAPIHLGHYITGISRRKNVIDDYFLLQKSIDERYADVKRIYQTQLETELIELLDKYDATHVLVPVGDKGLAFEGNHCFVKGFDKRIRIYERDPQCEVKVVA